MAKIKRRRSSVAFTILGLVLLAFTIACRFVGQLADFYSLHIYPAVSFVLSLLSSVFPFTLQGIVIVALIVLALAFPAVAIIRKWGWKKFLRKEGMLLVWVYVWFYLGWCVNYSRSSIYTRIDASQAVYDEAAFRAFLNNYVEKINGSWTDVKPMDSTDFESQMKDFYKDVPKEYGLAGPRSWQHPKPMLFNRLWSATGIQGFMGPLFSETHLNSDLLPIEHPYVQAHEYSHLLGVSNEAEANWWAYQVCMASRDPGVRYSALLKTMPYVWSNAKESLPEEDFKAWTDTIRPEVKNDLRAVQKHWQELRSPAIDKVQSWMYDIFLKANNIPSGTKNYSEVVQLLISLKPLS